MVEGIAVSLQHPRRSLGDRHRSQAQKFLKLSKVDTSRKDENLGWAEQNARQALLHDFTHPDNWRTLATIKEILSDEIGLRALLSDLFSVLGRDPEQVKQLEGVPILDMGVELLEAALNRDHLDPDLWHSSMDGESVVTFCERFSELDFSDPRCNVLFGRRLERLWATEGDDICIPLARILLSSRPQNFEMWTELGRAHERLESFDEAWFCYDQAQSNAPQLDVRDQFRLRMEVQMETGRRLPWKPPSIAARDDFLTKMETLASRFYEQMDDLEIETVEQVDENQDEVKLQQLLDAGEYATAFFMSRRLITRGEQWVENYLIQAQQGLESDDDVQIP